MIQHSNPLEHALALDPNLIAAASRPVVEPDQPASSKGLSSSHRARQAATQNARPFHSGYLRTLAGSLRSPRADPILPPPLASATFNSVPAPERSSNSANSIGPTILSNSMRARSRPTTLLLAFCCAKAGQRSPRGRETYVERSSLSPRSHGSLRRAPPAFGTRSHGERC